MSAAGQPNFVLPPRPLTAEDFQKITDVSRETLGRLQVYADLLTERQRVQNLVSNRSLADLWGRHMLDSFQLIRYLPCGVRGVTDIGSGAGFPGLVMAIATGLPVTLVEAHARKCAFLRDAIDATGASAVVVNARVDAYAHESKKNPVDILTARALAPLSKLCGMADSLGAHTCLFQKGARWRDELTEARKLWKMVIETFPSQTSPEARILRITDLVPK